MGFHSTRGRRSTERSAAVTASCGVPAAPSNTPLTRAAATEGIFSLRRGGRRLPAPAMHHVIERPAIRLLDGGKGAIGRVTERDQIRTAPIGSMAEDLTSELFISCGGMPAADPKIRGSEHHRHRRLAEVVLDRRGGASVIALRGQEGDGRRRGGDMACPPPDLREGLELLAISAHYEVPPLAVASRRGAASGLQNPVQVLLGNGPVGVHPDISTRPNRIPCLHGGIVLPGARYCPRSSRR